MEKMIREQQALIDNLSQITFENKEEAMRKFRECLKFTKDGKADIVTNWIELKQRVFRNYISTKIFMIPQLLTSTNPLFGLQQNYAKTAFNSIEKVFKATTNQWRQYLSFQTYNQIILNKDQNSRKQALEKLFLQFFN